MDQNMDIRAVITQMMMNLTDEQKAMLAALSPEERAQFEQIIEQMVAEHEGGAQAQPGAPAGPEGMDFSALSGAILGK